MCSIGADLDLQRVHRLMRQRLPVGRLKGEAFEQKTDRAGNPTKVALGCTILLLHQIGYADKKQTLRNLALIGALDAEYWVERKKDGVANEWRQGGRAIEVQTSRHDFGALLKTALGSCNAIA